MSEVTTLGGRFALGARLDHDIPGIDRYMAHDQRLERPAVVDMLGTLSPAAIRQEATRVSRLRDPRLARVIATGRETIEGKDVTYIAIEHVPGHRLDTLLAEHTLPPRVAVAIVGGAARALTAARAAGLHHGFLRPAAITVTDRGRVVVAGVGVDGEAAWQAGLAPMRAEGPDAAALSRILVEALTGRPVDEAAEADLPDELPASVGALARRALAEDPPGTLAQIIDALSPLDSRELMGFSRLVAAMPLSHALQLEQDRLAAEEAARLAAEEEAAREERLAATDALLDDATLAQAGQSAAAEVASSLAHPDLQESLDHQGLAPQEPVEAAPFPIAMPGTDPATEPVPTVEDEEPADKYEESFDTLEVMVAEQHAARSPSTWELVLERLHGRWPRSRAITRALDRARERANSGGPLNGARITMLLAVIAVGFAVWLALGWLETPLSTDFQIEQDGSTPAASDSPAASPTPSDASPEPNSAS